MPNKRNRKCKEIAGLIKGHAQTCKSNVVVSESLSCSSDDTSLKRDSGLLAEDTEYSADAVVSHVDLTEEDQSLFGENKSTAAIKFAPIFLRTTQHIRGNGGRSARLCQSFGKRTLMQKSVTTPYRHDLQVVNSQHRAPSSHTFSQAEKKRPTLSCLRGELSSSALNGCLEEIGASNPAFPVRRVFAALQKKCRKSLQALASPEKTLNPNTPSLPQRSIGEKRKRHNERETSEKALKHRRFSPAAEEASVSSHYSPSGQSTQGYIALPIKGQPRRSRLSHTHKLKQQKESGGLVNVCELKSNLTTHADSESLPLITSEIDHKDSNVEDGLWTDKYSPQHSSEVIGNSTSVKKLHSWLKKWKLRADCDERRKARERKLEENSNDSWDCGDFQGEVGFEEEGEEQLCNTMLITGPPGVGKTASVYACAQELGFKVFEVNCSSQRNGCHVLTQLKEATQSHLMETSGKDLLKPAYLNNYNTNSCSTKPVTLPGKTTSPKKVVSTSKRRPGKNLCSSVRKRKPSPATVTLANFFKFKAKADNIPYGDLSSEKLASEILYNLSLGTDKTPAGQSKRMATSLILFEEVDVIFDDDVGFLTAIKTFMTTTKRPVILTTNDPSFKDRFDGNLEEIIFKAPSVVNACSYLRLLCLAENVRTELGDVTSLLRVFQGDVRRCLLQLQLWVHSGGERAPQRAVLPEDPAGPDVIEVKDGFVTQLPPRDESCTASMLGLQSLLSFLKCQSWTEPDMNTFIQALTESWRRGVSLLYSNLELLLPLPGRALENNPEAVTLSGFQSEPTPPDIQPHIQQLDQVVDLTASINLVRTISRLSRRKYMPSVSDSRSSPSVRLDSYRTSLTLKKTDLRTLSSNDKPKTEPNVAKQCLDALTDFTDLMSYLDATMQTREPRIHGPCRSGDFVWTGAGISDGLLDEMREWDDGSCSREMLLEIQAAVEGLGFQRCWRRLSEVWSEAQRGKQDLGDEKLDELVEILKLPVSAYRKSFSFSLPSFCEPSVAQRRYELSRTVLCSRSFSLLGNKQAVHVDYMPVLRSICRSEKAQQQGKTPSRFLSYLNSIHLGLSKSTIQVLAEDFP